MATRRAGRYTIALALILLGAGLLVDNLQGTLYTLQLLRLWPLVLVGMGLEFLFWSQRSGTRAAADWGGILLLLAAGLLVNLYYQGPFSLRWPQAGPYPSQYEHHQEQTVPAQGLQEIRIDTESTRLVVQRGTSAEVQLDYTVTGQGFSEAEAQANALARKLVVERSAGVLFVDIQMAQVLARPLPTAPDSRLQVTVPPGVRVYLDVDSGGGEVTGLQGDLTIDAGSGAVEVSDIAGNLQLDSGSGPVEVSDIAGNLQLHSGSGPVRVIGVAGDLRLDSGSGAVHLEGVQGAIVLKGGSGRISIIDPGASVRGEVGSGGLRLLTGMPVAGDYDLEAGSGSIHVSFPDNSAVTVTAVTQSGSIMGPHWLQVDDDVASGKLGDGTHQVKLRTGSGIIGVRTDPAPSK